MKKYERLIQFLLFCGSICLIALLSQRFYLRADTTRQKTYTLSPYTKSVLSRLDAVLSITWFKSYNADGYIPSLQYIEDMLAEYQRYAPERCIVTKKDTDNLSPQALQGLGLSGQQIEKNTRTTQIRHTLYSGLLCEYRGKTRVIPFLTDIYTLEADIARFITEMTQDAQNKTAERSLYILMPPENGGSETGLYRYVLPWIEYAGFVPILLPHSFTELKPEIPLLAIGSSYFDSTMLTALDVFLQKNGSAAFFISPHTVDVFGNWNAVPKEQSGIFDVLARYGFIFEPALIMDTVSAAIRIPSADNSGYQTVQYPFWPIIFPRPEDTEKKRSQKGVPAVPLLIPAGKAVQLFWPAPLEAAEVRGSTIVPLLVSTPQASLQKPPYTTDPYRNQLEDARYAEHTAYCAGAVSIGIDGRRICAVADEYCISTAIEYTNSDGNMDFLVNVLHWIAGHDALLAVKQKQPAVLPFRYFEDEKTFYRLIAFSRVLSLVIIPLLCAASAAFMYRRLSVRT